MKENPYITIGIPFYNSEKYLEDAICSVLAQTHEKWELLLVDDGSSDGSLNIARKYEHLDSRVRVISDGENKKLPFRLNQIVKESSYDYIARMDADDLMSNDRLEVQLRGLEENPEIDFVSSGCLTIGKNNELTGIRKGENFQVDAAMILEGTTNILHASLLAKKSWYTKNLYNTKNIQAEDYELWLTAAKKNDLNYLVIEEPLYWYRVTENVTLEKLVRGYNSQIEVINNNYKNVISEYEKLLIIGKFQRKKLIVKALSKLNLLNILLKRRSQPYSAQDIAYYNQHYSRIMRYKEGL